MKEDIGLVIIGRNEGDRLKRCIESTVDLFAKRVYVDSGSTDGSLELANKEGLEIVNLDMSIPFSAARARNAGFKRLVDIIPILKYVHFIDGDCEINRSWIIKGKNFLDINSEFAIVAGRRIEKYPDSTIYNMMCHVEWNTPVGEADACGGDFIARKEAFQDVQGFNPSVIAGEEPELCYRLRKNNWKIFRYDAEMTYHDAAIERFSQWWSRSKRTGHAYLQGFSLHHSDKNGYYRREIQRDWLWGLVVPLIIMIISLITTPLFLVLFTIYPLRFIRIIINLKEKIDSKKNRMIYGLFLIISPFPQLLGQFLYIKRKITGNNLEIIEYS